MDEKQLKLCMLCHKVLEDNFEIVENITMEMMDILLIKENFLFARDILICTTCFESVKELFIFKSVCLDVEESINQCIRTLPSKKRFMVGLEEVYFSRRAKESKMCMLHKKVCRFCLQLYQTNAMNEIREDHYLTDVLKKYYPELDLSTTGGISACSNCFNCLMRHYNFVTNLLETKKNVNICNMAVNDNDLLELGSVLAFSLEEDFDIIKSEELHIKAETNVNFIMPAEDKTLPERPQREAGQKQIYLCNYCPFKTKKKNFLNKHSRKHSYLTQSNVYKCDLCPFESCYKHSMKRHTLTHMKYLDTASFKSEQELHRIEHKDAAEVVTFKCDKCPFTANYKGNLQKHSLVHKSCSEVTMHKCDCCSFQTKHKISLKTHMLRHKSPSELTLNKCHLCGFTTLHKGNLKVHLLMHEDVDAVMYKCDSCAFETKYKMSLKTHVLRHRRLSDVQMHK